MRRLLFLVVIAFALAGDVANQDYRSVLGKTANLTATRIVFDATDPARDRAGALTFLKGWELSSADPAFGGFSAMAVTDGGLLLLSDAGGIVRLRLDAQGDIGAAAFADLPSGPGSGALKADRDSEALTRDGADGDAWVAFENSNAIWRYTGDLGRAKARAAPAAMRRWPENGGAEAMVRLRSGRFIVFSERGRGPPGSAEALLFDRDPTDPAAMARTFHYRPPDGFQITDAAALPDGRLLLLHRRIGVRPYLSAKLAILDPAAIRAGDIAFGEEIATLAPPIAVDNMEAIAVTREGARTIVWVASDDNIGGAFQRSLLLKLALDPSAGN